MNSRQEGELNERILVTGGAGYVGSVCVAHLRERGYQVLVYDNLSTGHKAAVVEGVPIEVADLADRASLSRVMSSFRPAFVMHFAASALLGESMRKPLDYYANNVTNGQNLIRVMLDHGIRSLIFSSTCAIYGEPEHTPMTEDDPRRPINPYGRSKLAFEHLLEDCDKAYGLKSVCLRYFNAAGAASGLGEDHDPETHLIPNVLKAALGLRKQLVVFGSDYPTHDGTCVRDYVHIADIADAHEKALDILRLDRSDKINLGNGKGFSVLEVIRTSERLLGESIPYKVSARREGDPAVLVASAEKAGRVLGWKPAYSSLESIIESALMWHREHPNGYGS
jgi:UDP-glucose 4-epimerase